MILDCVPKNGAWDICVVGSGPIGMALALELGSLGQSVLVLESGETKPNRKFEEFTKAEIIDVTTHAPMELAACRALGGTSWLWGGRCVPFDEIDFVTRKYVPHSGWPITHEAIKPWYGAAAKYTLCGEADFERSIPGLPDVLTNMSATHLERWATEPRVAIVHREAIARSRNITLCLRSTVVGLTLNSEGTAVCALSVAGTNGISKIGSRRVVLAAGGVETTRLLLNTQREWPRHFGGAQGPLGAFYMGHVTGQISNILFRDPKLARAFDYQRESNGGYVRRRLSLDPQTQEKHALLNTAFLLDNPPFNDPSHHNAALSAIFLALAFPPTGKKLLAEGIRRYHVGPPPYRLANHALNMLVGAPKGARDILEVLYHRYLLKPRKPAPLLRSHNGRYALAYHAEQAPNIQSRIRLSSKSDSLGVPRAAIDLKFGTQDASSILESHLILDQALKLNGIGHIEYRYPQSQLFEAVARQSSDGYHQVGTTRMGFTSRDSIVDSDLKAHEIDNLYIASSSVFPTSGQANPTFLGVALGVRLAHHLASRLVPAWH